MTEPSTDPFAALTAVDPLLGIAVKYRRGLIDAGIAPPVADDMTATAVAFFTASALTQSVGALLAAYPNVDGRVITGLLSALSARRGS